MRDMADPFATARDYLARLRRSGGGDHPLLLEPPAPPAVTGPELLATLDTEEALFRIFWTSLPDKTLARQTWPSDLRYYCRVKRLEVEMMEQLEKRCGDLEVARLT